MATNTVLPRRPGERPETGRTVHAQLSQTGPMELHQELWRRMTKLDGVVVGRSHVSLPRSRALHLAPALAEGPDSAFFAGTEFAHLHSVDDSSLHAMLPFACAADAIEAGWAESHPLVRRGLLPHSALMVYGPRDSHELDIVWQLVQQSYAFARGLPVFP
ncbi:luciferase domain-containing protein [Streptomyces chartreusis]|uniref:luciferase domain-containing protein n=1 Tax=Streptomyces chartreusis TaxID=1969 RepID=UPI0033BEDF08